MAIKEIRLCGVDNEIIGKAAVTVETLTLPYVVNWGERSFIMRPFLSQPDGLPEYKEVSTGQVIDAGEAMEAECVLGIIELQAVLGIKESRDYALTRIREMSEVQKAELLRAIESYRAVRKRDG